MGRVGAETSGGQSLCTAGYAAVAAAKAVLNRASRKFPKSKHREGHALRVRDPQNELPSTHL